MSVTLNKLIIIFLFTAVAIVIALRPEEFEPDLKHYFRFWNSGVYPISMEPGFVFLSKELSNFLTVRGVLLTYTILTMIIFAISYKKPYYVEKVALAFFALLPE